jgi:glycosyltransferase involved in cell wall biosynthesis
MLDVVSELDIKYELLTNNTSGFLDKWTCQANTFNYKNSANKLLTLINFIFAQIMMFKMTYSKLSESNCENKLLLLNTILPAGAALAGKLCGVKVVYYIHEKSVNPPILKSMLKYVFTKTCSHSIYVSNFLENSESVPSIPSTIIYNSLGKAEKKISRRMRISDNFIVFMASSLKPYKGINEFVLLAKSLPHLNFTIALNCEESEFDKFKLKNSKLSNLTLYRRPSNIQLERLYQNSSIVLSLSHPEICIESFGMTVIEAFRFGKPVIVPNVGGISELVKNSYNGFKISILELNKVESTIKILSRNSDLLQRLSQNALESVNNYIYANYKLKMERLLCSM